VQRREPNKGDNVMLSKRLLVFLVFIMVCNIYAEQQEIVIATLEYPPFIYSENNQVKGIIVDKIRDVFGKLEVKVTIKIYPIARGLLMVKNGEVDAYFSLKKTPEREKELLFTKEPLIQQPFVFFTRNDSRIIWHGNLKDIKNYRIGIVSKTSYGTVFDEYLKKGFIQNIDETQTFEQNIKKLIAGRVDLIINSYDVGQYILKKLNASNRIIALSPPVEVVNSYLAFTKTKDYTSLAKEYDIILANEKK